MVNIYIPKELEKQRYGRNKETLVNRSYINSGEFRRKFDFISENTILNRILYKLAKRMLEHRSGTLYEDMYWIDLNTLTVVAEETNSEIEEGIIYSKRIEQIVKENDNLLTIHTHPHSFPPSISDLNSNYLNNYSAGIVVCHNGTIYMYNVFEEIPERYYEMTVAEYLQQGCDESHAQILALDEIKEKFKIQFKEVTGEDV